MRVCVCGGGERCFAADLQGRGGALRVKTSCQDLFLTTLYVPHNPDGSLMQRRASFAHIVTATTTCTITATATATLVHVAGHGGCLVAAWQAGGFVFCATHRLRVQQGFQPSFQTSV